MFSEANNSNNFNTYPSNPQQPIYLSPNYQQLIPTSNFSTVQPPPSVSPCSPGGYQIVAIPTHVQCPISYASTSNNTQFTQAGNMQGQQTSNPFMSSPYNIRPQMETNIPIDGSNLLNMDTQQNVHMSRGFPADMTFPSELGSNYLDNGENMENLSENLSGQLKLYEEGANGLVQNTNKGDQSRNDFENMSTDSITGIANIVYDKITKG